jgi:hypothetical protein
MAGFCRRFAFVTFEGRRIHAREVVTTYEGFDHINNTWVHAMPRAVADFASLSR